MDPNWSRRLTSRNNHPKEVHQEVITPEVQEFWSAVNDTLVVVIEHAGCVVQDDAVELASADDHLKRVAQWVRDGDEACDDEAEGSPQELCASVDSGERGERDERHTAVMVSMHSTNGSEVKYLESDSAYSFHSCPKRSCFGPIRVWLTEKYPVCVSFLLVPIV